MRAAAAPHQLPEPGPGAHNGAGGSGATAVIWGTLQGRYGPPACKQRSAASQAHGSHVWAAFGAGCLLRPVVAHGSSGGGACSSAPPALNHAPGTPLRL